MDVHLVQHWTQNSYRNYGGAQDIGGVERVFENDHVAHEQVQHLEITERSYHRRFFVLERQTFEHLTHVVEDSWDHEQTHAISCVMRKVVHRWDQQEHKQTLADRGHTEPERRQRVVNVLVDDSQQDRHHRRCDSRDRHEQNS